MWGLSLVAASGGHSSSRCAGLSLSWPLLLRSTSSRRTGSVVVAHGPSCYAACGIFPDQGSNPCPLHWQADSQPLRHQGSPWVYVFWFNIWSPNFFLPVQCIPFWILGLPIPSLLQIKIRKLVQRHQSLQRELCWCSERPSLRPVHYTVDRKRWAFKRG